jgi:hypothetical protein
MYGLRTEATRLKREVDTTHAAYRTLYEESQDLYRRWEQASQTKSADAPRLAAEWRVKDQEAEQAKLLFTTAEDRYKSREAQGSVRLNTFKQEVFDQEKAITTYAATSAKECFADGYAAWRADPDFLQANAPKAFAWFQRLSGEQP